MCVFFKTLECSWSVFSNCLTGRVSIFLFDAHFGVQHWKRVKCQNFWFKKKRYFLTCPNERKYFFWCPQNALKCGSQQQQHRYLSTEDQNIPRLIHEKNIKNTNPNLNFLSRMLPGQLFLVCNLYFFNILGQPSYGMLYIAPSTEKTSVVYPL